MTADVTPAGARATRVTRWPAVRVFEHNAFVYRRTWRGSIFTSFISPILFLGAMGLGLGALVNVNSPQALGGLDYLTFLAPGLLAATMMQTAAFESTYPVLAGILWMKTYDAMVATPISPRAIVIGQLAWVATRLTLVSVVFLTVMVIVGASSLTGAVLSIPFAVMTGLAFAAPVQAFASTQRNDNNFSVIFRFVVTPLFLFSGTFFPISQLPDFLEPIAWFLPLFHGVSLTRGAALGTLDPGAALIHVGVLVGFIVAGALASMVLFRRRLVK